jgi:transposase InsO family protein
MEAFFSTVKTELGDRFETGDEATRALFEYVEAFYNSALAPFSTVGCASPAVFEQRAQSTQTSAR